jgi:hypothetical protein
MTNLLLLRSLATRSHIAPLGFAAILSLSGACGDDASEAGADAGGQGNDASSANPDDPEAPASCALLEDVVGTYTVTGPASGNDHRGASTADHDRGTVAVGADFSIDFDTDRAFPADTITTCYDRTTQDFDRRIQVSYGADDDGPVINFYLSADLEVEEIQYRHNADGENIRVAVDAS